MNNDNLISSPKEKRIRRKPVCLCQCKESPKHEDTDSFLNSEQNRTFPSKCEPKGKSKRGKSSETVVGSLAGTESGASPTQHRTPPHRSQQLSLLSNNALMKLPSKVNEVECCSEPLNLSCCHNSKSSKDVSPEVINLLCSVSLTEKHSSINDNPGDNKELVNNSITFSPVCSGQDSIASDVVDNVGRIIEILTEESSENAELSKQSTSPLTSEESNTVKDILKGVLAYVEVRSGHENRTKAIERQLLEMGAKILPRFLSMTTHVIFKDGRKSTRDKAVARNVPLVSVLWVESCKQQRCRVPEADFPASIPEIYDSPLLCRRIRKLKSMQPKDFNVEFAGSIERLNKIFSRIRQDNDYFSTSDSFCGSEASASLKDDDATSHDTIDHHTINRTPVSCKVPVTTRRLFDFSQDESKLTQLEDEVASCSKHKEKSSVPLATAVEDKKLVIKRRKLLSDLNQSPQLTPKHVKTKVKFNSTPRRRTGSKVGERTTMKLQTEVKSKNAQIENNHYKNSCVSLTDKVDQNNSEKGVVGSVLPLTSTKENTRSSLDDFEDKRHKKRKSVKTKCVVEDSFDSNPVNDSLDKTTMKKSTIVLTSLQSTDREVMYSIIESLGGFQIKRSVTETTTHVISGDNRRTLNVLFGLVRGCWILSSQWVYKSMEAGRWVEEEPFQLSEYFHTSQASHLECSDCRPGYCKDLFGQLGNIFVSRQCNPSCDDLTDLIRLAGGKVCTCLRRCEVLIGPYKQSRRESRTNPGVVHLSEKWILDCISQHRTLPFDNYKT